MEVGIARLESDIEHIQADVTDLKLGQQRLDAKIDDLGKRLDTKIDDLGKRLDTRIDESNNAHGARFDKLEAKIDELIRLTGAEKAGALIADIDRRYLRTQGHAKPHRHGDLGHE